MSKKFLFFTTSLISIISSAGLEATSTSAKSIIPASILLKQTHKPLTIIDLHKITEETKKKLVLLVLKELMIARAQEKERKVHRYNFSGEPTLNGRSTRPLADSFGDQIQTHSFDRQSTRSQEYVTSSEAENSKYRVLESHSENAESLSLKTLSQEGSTSSNNNYLDSDNQITSELSRNNSAMIDLQSHDQNVSTNEKATHIDYYYDEFTGGYYSNGHWYYSKETYNRILQDLDSEILLEELLGGDPKPLLKKRELIEAQADADQPVIEKLRLHGRPMNVRPVDADQPAAVNNVVDLFARAKVGRNTPPPNKDETRPKIESSVKKFLENSGIILPKNSPLIDSITNVVQRLKALRPETPIQAIIEPLVAGLNTMFVDKSKHVTSDPEKFDVISTLIDKKLSKEFEPYAGLFQGKTALYFRKKLKETDTLEDSTLTDVVNEAIATVKGSSIPNPAQFETNFDDVAEFKAYLIKVLTPYESSFAELGGVKGYVTGKLETLKDLKDTSVNIVLDEVKEIVKGSTLTLLTPESTSPRDIYLEIIDTSLRPYAAFFVDKTPQEYFEGIEDLKSQEASEAYKAISNIIKGANFELPKPQDFNTIEQYIKAVAQSITPYAAVNPRLKDPLKFVTEKFTGIKKKDVEKISTVISSIQKILGSFRPLEPKVYNFKNEFIKRLAAQLTPFQHSLGVPNVFKFVQAKFQDIDLSKPAATILIQELESELKKFTAPDVTNFAKSQYLALVKLRLDTAESELNAFNSRGTKTPSKTLGDRVIEKLKSLDLNTPEAADAIKEGQLEIIKRKFLVDLKEYSDLTGLIPALAKKLRDHSVLFDKDPERYLRDKVKTLGIKADISKSEIELQILLDEIAEKIYAIPLSAKDQFNEKELFIDSLVDSVSRYPTILGGKTAREYLVDRFKGVDNIHTLNAQEVLLGIEKSVQQISYLPDPNAFEREEYLVKLREALLPYQEVFQYIPLPKEEAPKPKVEEPQLSFAEQLKARQRKATAQKEAAVENPLDSYIKHIFENIPDHKSPEAFRALSKMNENIRLIEGISASLNDGHNRYLNHGVIDKDVLIDDLAEKLHSLNGLFSDSSLKEALATRLTLQSAKKSSDIIDPIVDEIMTRVIGKSANDFIINLKTHFGAKAQKLINEQLYKDPKVFIDRFALILTNYPHFLGIAPVAKVHPDYNNHQEQLLKRAHELLEGEFQALDFQSIPFLQKIQEIENHVFESCLKTLFESKKAGLKTYLINTVLKRGEDSDLGFYLNALRSAIQQIEPIASGASVDLEGDKTLATKIFLSERSRFFQSLGQEETESAESSLKKAKKANAIKAFSALINRSLDVVVKDEEQEAPQGFSATSPDSTIRNYFLIQPFAKVRLATNMDAEIPEDLIARYKFSESEREEIKDFALSLLVSKSIQDPSFKLESTVDGKGKKILDPEHTLYTASLYLNLAIEQLYPEDVRRVHVPSKPVKQVSANVESYELLPLTTPLIKEDLNGVIEDMARKTQITLRSNAEKELEKKSLKAQKTGDKKLAAQVLLKSYILSTFDKPLSYFQALALQNSSNLRGLILGLVNKLDKNKTRYGCDLEEKREAITDAHFMRVNSFVTGLDAKLGKVLKKEKITLKEKAFEEILSVAGGSLEEKIKTLRVLSDKDLLELHNNILGPNDSDDIVESLTKVDMGVRDRMERILIQAFDRYQSIEDAKALSIPEEAIGIIQQLTGKDISLSDRLEELESYDDEKLINLYNSTIPVGTDKKAQVDNDLVRYLVTAVRYANAKEMKPEVNFEISDLFIYLMKNKGKSEHKIDIEFTKDSGSGSSKLSSQEMDDLDLNFVSALLWEKRAKVLQTKLDRERCERELARKTKRAQEQEIDSIRKILTTDIGKFTKSVSIEGEQENFLENLKQSEALRQRHLQRLKNLNSQKAQKLLEKADKKIKKEQKKLEEERLRLEAERLRLEEERLKLEEEERLKRASEIVVEETGNLEGSMPPPPQMKGTIPPPPGNIPLPPQMRGHVPPPPNRASTSAPKKTFGRGTATQKVESTKAVQVVKKIDDMSPQELLALTQEEISTYLAEESMQNTITEITLTLATKGVPIKTNAVLEEILNFYLAAKAINKKVSVEMVADALASDLKSGIFTALAVKDKKELEEIVKTSVQKVSTAMGKEEFFQSIALLMEPFKALYQKDLLTVVKGISVAENRPVYKTESPANFEELNKTDQSKLEDIQLETRRSYRNVWEHLDLVNMNSRDISWYIKALVVKGFTKGGKDALCERINSILLVHIVDEKERLAALSRIKENLLRDLPDGADSMSIKALEKGFMDMIEMDDTFANYGHFMNAIRDTLENVESLTRSAISDLGTNSVYCAKIAHEMVLEFFEAARTGKVIDPLKFREETDRKIIEKGFDDLLKHCSTVSGASKYADSFKIIAKSIFDPNSSVFKGTTYTKEEIDQLYFHVKRMFYARAHASGELVLFNISNLDEFNRQIRPWINIAIKQTMEGRDPVVELKKAYSENSEINYDKLEQKMSTSLYASFVEALAYEDVVDMATNLMPKGLADLVESFKPDELLEKAISALQSIKEDITEFQVSLTTDIRSKLLARFKERTTALVDKISSDAAIKKALGREKFDLLPDFREKLGEPFDPSTLGSDRERLELYNSLVPETASEKNYSSFVGDRIHRIIDLAKQVDNTSTSLDFTFYDFMREIYGLGSAKFSLMLTNEVTKAKEGVDVTLSLLQIPVVARYIWQNREMEIADCKEKAAKKLQEEKKKEEIGERIFGILTSLLPMVDWSKEPETDASEKDGLTKTSNSSHLQDKREEVF